MYFIFTIFPRMEASLEWKPLSNGSPRVDPIESYRSLLEYKPPTPFRILDAYYHWVYMSCKHSTLYF